MARDGIRMPDEAEPDFPSRFLACADTSSRRTAPGVVPKRPKTSSSATSYRVTIRLRGLGGEVGSQGSGVESRRL